MKSLICDLCINVLLVYTVNGKIGFEYDDVVVVPVSVLIS